MILNYPTACHDEGAPEFTFFDVDGVQGIDLGSDGSVEVIRSQDAVLFDGKAISSYPSIDGWVSVPLGDDTLLDEFAVFTELRSLSYFLLVDDRDPLELALPDPGVDLTGPNAPVFDVTEDDQGVVQAVSITRSVPEDTPGSWTEASIRSVPADSLPDLVVPGSDAITDLADLEVLPLILGSAVWNPSCAPNTDTVESVRACIERLVGDVTVGEWVTSADGLGWLSPADC